MNKKNCFIFDILTHKHTHTQYKNSSTPHLHSELHTYIHTYISPSFHTTFTNMSPAHTYVNAHNSQIPGYTKETLTERKKKAYTLVHCSRAMAARDREPPAIADRHVRYIHTKNCH